MCFALKILVEEKKKKKICHSRTLLNPYGPPRIKEGKAVINGVFVYITFVYTKCIQNKTTNAKLEYLRLIITMWKKKLVTPRIQSH